MYYFIVNPKAGGGKAQRVFDRLQKSDIYTKLTRTSQFTKHKGHAEQMMKKIALEKDSIRSIIVVGGDGTIHEVMNGMKKNNMSDIPVSFIPSGSGNDFARGNHISKDPIDTLQRIIDGTTGQSYYVGNYVADEHTMRYFVNCIGLGIDAEVVALANSFHWKKWFDRLRVGRLVYVFVLVIAVLRFKPFDIDIECNNQTSHIKDCWLISVTNHPYFGGGMKVIPTAKIQPKIFPFIIIHSVPKWKVLLLFITIFFGKHLHVRGVTIKEDITTLRMKSCKAILYQVDGELKKGKDFTITKQATPIKIQSSVREKTSS